MSTHVLQAPFFHSEGSFERSIPSAFALMLIERCTAGHPASSLSWPGLHCLWLEGLDRDILAALPALTEGALVFHFDVPPPGTLAGLAEILDRLPLPVEGPLLFIDAAAPPPVLFPSEDPWRFAWAFASDDPARLIRLEIGPRVLNRTALRSLLRSAQDEGAAHERDWLATVQETLAETGETE